jgi:hypothetical protein
MLARGGKRQKPCPAQGFQNAEQGLDSNRNALDATTAAWQPRERQQAQQRRALRPSRRL